MLSTALLIAIIGISAMLAARVEHRALVDTEAAVKADFGAQSLMDLGLYWITADSNWRTTYTADTWTSPLVTDSMTLRFKLVDEIDGNLANDPTQPVRLYAKAVVGRAVRMESVLCQPASGWNLVINGGFESGLTGWYSRKAALESRTDNPHSGTFYVRVKARTDVTDGLGQKLTSGIERGSTYQIDIWVKLKSGTDTLIVGLLTNSTRSGYSELYGTPTAIGTAWQKVTTILTPTWEGVLLSADLHMRTADKQAEFDVDDVSMIEQSTQPTLVPIPGTWRQEIRTGTPAMVPEGTAVPMPS